MSLVEWSEHLVKYGWEDLYEDQKKGIKHIEKKIGNNYYPPAKYVFRAYKYTPLNNVRVVIFGQDPYHKEGQAMGLSFSVKKGETVPPSLKNIYKSAHEHVPGFKIPKHGDLTKWAKQGVLMLNIALTVAPHQPKSHMEPIDHWGGFLNATIHQISTHRRSTIFVLWGGQAVKTIDNSNKCKVKYILKGGHPSPLNTSIANPFIGGEHMVEINNILVNKLKEEPIDWNL